MLLKTRQTWLRVLIGLLAALVIMPVLLVSCMFAGRFMLASQDDAMDRAAEAHFVPEAGRDIYCRGTGLYRVFEFKVSEEGFRDWADQLGVSLTEVSGEFTIPRYLQMETPVPTDPSADIAAYERRTRVVIRNGLHGERRANNGGGYTIGYDRSNLTAYAQWSWN